MDTQSGKIKQYTTEELKALPADQAERLVILSEQQARKMKSMNRHERRKYYSTHKKEFVGKTWAEVKDLI